MPDLGKTVLGTYSAACEGIRGACPKVISPQVGDIIFFRDNKNARHAGANHIGIIYKIDGGQVYTFEGNTSGDAGLVDNGGCVAAKHYSIGSPTIYSYARPRYNASCPMDKVLNVASGEVGYIEKKSNSNLDDKTANAGSSNYTKYGKWMGCNGDYWCASFISWCFHAAYDDSSGYVPTSGGSSDSFSTGTALSATFGQSGGNSSLVNYVNRLSSGLYNERTKPISKITVHIARQIGDIHELSRLLNSSEQCYNYGIDNQGTVGLFVNENQWTSSSNSTENDEVSVNIVCMNETLEPDYKISQECEESLYNLMIDIVRRNFIFNLTFTGDPKKDTITIHSEFNPKSECPGQYVEECLKRLVIRSQQDLITQSAVNWTQVSARLATSQTEALKAQSTVSINSIHPYVVSPHPDQLGVEYAKLKDLGVVGVFLDAGQRFDKNHEEVKYRIESIYKQTLEVKQGQLPHAYYYTTRARDEKEVREEAYWFYFILSKYPPKLGIWLRCQFDVKDSVAQELVERWYEFFVDWGLKSKCGLYATVDQAKKIGWPKQCTYMPLWLEGELTDATCPDEEILTPSFFKLDSLKNEGFNVKTTSIESLGTGYYTGRVATNTVEVRYNSTSSQNPNINTSQVGQASSSKQGFSISSGWTGTKLSSKLGSVEGPNRGLSNSGPNGRETFYDLNMSGCVKMLRTLKIEGDYWEREDGVKMYGPYVMVAAPGIPVYKDGKIDHYEENPDYPRGTTGIPTTLGMAIIADYGDMKGKNDLDIATNWKMGPNHWGTA